MRVGRGVAEKERVERDRSRSGTHGLRHDLDNAGAWVASLAIDLTEGRSVRDMVKWRDGVYLYENFSWRR
jgi:hypothetical protein